jgi:RNA polymerase sigma-70 factor (ECF subfamily)
MGETPLTKPSLLIRICDAGDREAWEQFVEIYAPLVYGFSRKHGFQDADAADLTQEVLRTVSAAVGRQIYTPSRGSFRGWLFTIVRNKVRNFLASRGRQCQGSGSSREHELLEAQAAPADSAADFWDQEYERRLFLWAAERVRSSFQDSTWQAFWQSAVEGQSPKAVAQALGMTVGAVYIAKSRILAKLKEQIQELKAE